jgi:hypothetical protein
LNAANILLFVDLELSSVAKGHIASAITLNSIRMSPLELTNVNRKDFIVLVGLPC